MKTQFLITLAIIFTCSAMVSCSDKQPNNQHQQTMTRSTQTIELNIQNYLVDAICNKNMLNEFQVFLEKISLYGLIDPPDAKIAANHRAELESLWNQAFSSHQSTLVPILLSAKQDNPEYQIDSEKIISKINQCKAVTAIEYYDQKIDKIIYQINDRYLSLDS